MYSRYGVVDFEPYYASGAMSELLDYNSNSWDPMQDEDGTGDEIGSYYNYYYYQPTNDQVLSR